MNQGATMSNQVRHHALRAGPPQAVTIFAMQKYAPTCSGRCARRYVFSIVGILSPRCLTQGKKSLSLNRS
jgi:hypothetical protein